MSYNFNQASIYKNALLNDNQCFNQFPLQVKNQIPTKSIYTEDSSRIYFPYSLASEKYVPHQMYSNEGEDDIQNFLQKSKSLKEKIYDKLGKNKVNNNVWMIKQTTFGPKNKINNRSKENVKRNQVKSQLKSPITKIKNKKTKRQKTQMETTWNQWQIQASNKSINAMNFSQRQQKTLKNKEEKVQKLKKQKEQKQMMGCTFKPALTSYRRR